MSRFGIVFITIELIVLLSFPNHAGFPFKREYQYQFTVLSHCMLMNP